MKKICIFLALAAIYGCSPRIVTVAVHDTTTLTRTVTLRDTVIPAPLPAERVIISTPDTTSTIETSLAVSTATLTAGHLRHTIENKRTALKVPAKIPEKKEVIREVKEVPVPVEVPKPYIPRWVYWAIAWAAIATLALIGIILLIFRK